MKKIGIMGGTFNPIHKGHIEIAKSAYEQYSLDEVWFMPNYSPAYKSDKGIVSGEHRLNMILLAIRDYDYFKTSDIELKRERKTYSFETFTVLKKLYPETHFYFIMGADSLFYFDKWVHPEIIIENTDVIVAARDNNGINEINDKISELSRIYGDEHFFVTDCSEINCSSSDIRKYFNILNNNDSFSDKTNMKKYIEVFVPESVIKYINDNKLY